MTTKLYVSNVPADTTESALRQHFAACGGVCDVEILPERRGAAAAKSRGLATVTMTSPTFTAAALALDGTPFEGNVLRVSDAPVTAAGKPAKPRITVVQQYREKTSMSYDLDCAGLALTLRLSANDDACMVEASAKTSEGAVVASGMGATREGALVDVIRVWNEGPHVARARPLEREDLLQVMRDVRAI